jgi:hypothetical protein
MVFKVAIFQKVSAAKLWTNFSFFLLQFYTFHYPDNTETVDPGRCNGLGM